MIFVDTGGWYGLSIPEDPNHLAATTWSVQNRHPLLTTDYVVDETLTLLKSRRQRAVALSLARQFFDGSLATIYYLTELLSDRGRHPGRLAGLHALRRQGMELHRLHQQGRHGEVRHHRGIRL